MVGFLCIILCFLLFSFFLCCYFLHSIKWIFLSFCFRSDTQSSAYPSLSASKYSCTVPLHFVSFIVPLFPPPSSTPPSMPFFVLYPSKHSFFHASLISLLPLPLEHHTLFLSLLPYHRLFLKGTTRRMKCWLSCCIK